VNRNRPRSILPLAVAAALLAVPRSAHASMFEGETLDAVADGISWVVLVLVPVVGIAVFWLVHILPEKIAEKKQHPQVEAIQTLCLLSLVFGGLLWPLAWLWAYSKPVFYKMAYGEDAVPHGHGSGEVEEDTAHGVQPDTKPGVEATGTPFEKLSELSRLRARVARLESELEDTKGGRS